MPDVLFGPAVLERWEKVLPQADVVRLEDAGHFVPEDAPDELANLLVDSSDADRSVAKRALR